MRTPFIPTAILVGLTLCGLAFSGCSTDQEKKTEGKAVTSAQEMGQQAAQALQKPTDAARQSAAQATSKNDAGTQMVRDAGAPPKETAAPEGKKGKGKLEGC